MRPFVLVKQISEIFDPLWSSHIDEGLPHVGLRVFVDGHLEEVLTSQKLFIYLVEQQTLRQSVWYIAHHQGCAGVSHDAFFRNRHPVDLQIHFFTCLRWPVFREGDHSRSFAL